MRRCRISKPTSPITSEEEKEDEAEFETAPRPDSLLRDVVESGSGSDDDDESESGPGNADEDEMWDAKPGPIDQTTREEALAIKQEYEDKIFNLAKNKGVSVRSLFRLVGDDTIKHRAVSAWNAFQKYQAKHTKKLDGGMFLSIYIFILSSILVTKGRLCSATIRAIPGTP